jgi:hypothetical protein
LLNLHKKAKGAELSLIEELEHRWENFEKKTPGKRDDRQGIWLWDWNKKRQKGFIIFIHIETMLYLALALVDFWYGFRAILNPHSISPWDIPLFLYFGLITAIVLLLDLRVFGWTQMDIHKIDCHNCLFFDSDNFCIRHCNDKDRFDPKRVRRVFKWKE